jgi:acetoin:2,6-dichlorophenolindophenol oxidoreductase subunit beta
MSRQIPFTQAINEAVDSAMSLDPKVLFFGLGADDPKRLFGTAVGLVEKFGRDRVFDMPTSENGMTGVAIGAALNGYRPIMTHLRLDFFLLAMDQLVNTAAKWHYMFGGQDSVPLVIRLVVGRGWGQGPTHSQSLQSWFAHIPGLKVVMPSTPADAKSLLTAAIADPNPVVFIEHRWLHNQIGEVPVHAEPELLGKAKLLHEGDAVTIVGMSYMTVEAVRAVRHLADQGINCDLIDLRTISPLDWPLIDRSLRKTGRLLALDTAASSFSVASEIIARAAVSNFSDLKAAPIKLASPDCPVPTSVGLSEQFYPSAVDIVEAVNKLVGTSISSMPLRRGIDEPHDVPAAWFKGPF